MKSITISCVNANEVGAVATISATLVKGQNTQVTIFKSMDDDMNKGTKNNRNPYLGRLTKREVYGGWVTGTNYCKSCENASERSGGTEFVAKQSWHTYYNDFFEVDKKTHSKYYLQLQRSEKQGSRKVTTYYLDGIELRTDSEAFAEVARSWFKTKSHTQSSSQVESGITAENERHYIVVALANIERIVQGEREISLMTTEVQKVA